MARFWVLATILTMLALAGLAALTDDRVASAQPPAVVTTAELNSPDSDVASATEPPARRRAYERRHQRSAAAETLPREAIAVVPAAEVSRIAAMATPEGVAEQAKGDKVADAQPSRRHVGEPPHRVRKSIRVRDQRLARHGVDRHRMERRQVANSRYHVPARRKVPRRLASNELTAGPARGEGT